MPRLTPKIYYCADRTQAKWLGAVWRLLYQHVPNRHRELDMTAFQRYYAAGMSPEVVAAMLIKNKAYDDRTTAEYEHDVIMGKQNITSHKGELIRYIPLVKALLLKNL